MKELWYPFYYKKKRNLDSFWKKKFLNGEKINKNHNYDFTFLKNNKSLEEKINYFSNEVRATIVKLHFRLPHSPTAHPSPPVLPDLFALKSQCPLTVVNFLALLGHSPTR